MDMMNSEHCGYEDKLFLTEPPEYLRCGICRLVLRNPVQLLQCGHKYCSECFQRIKGLAERNDRHLRCPLDRELVDVSRICEDIAFKRMVSSLAVKCLLAENGCSWTGELSDMKTHQEKCERLQVVPQTSVENSEVMALIRGFSGRIESCENSLIEKDKEISHLKLTISKMKTEHSDSIERLRNEVNQILGNTMKESNTELDDSKKNNQNLEKALKYKEEHIVIMENELNVAITNIQTLQLRVDAAEAQLNKNHQEIDEVEKKVVGLQRKVESTQTKTKQGRMDSVSHGLETKSGGEVIANTVKEVKTKKNYAMEVHKHYDDSKAVIENGNTIHLISCCWYSTITLPDAGVPERVKTWFEVKVMGFDPYDYLRVGWCCDEALPADGEFFEGIGSNQFSYCFNADRKKCYKKYNNNSHRFGKPVTVNDVIGVAFDAVDGQILFSLNGQWDPPMGVAFVGVDTTLSFYPAVEGYFSEVQVNFGEKEFSFGPPDRSYKKLIDL